MTYVTWRRPNPDDDRPTVPYSWFGWGHLYGRRWQYWPPWGVTYWWRPQAIDACDGERASKLVTVPLLGAIVWFFNSPCDCPGDASAQGCEPGQR
jgi:hypothetical protein